MFEAILFDNDGVLVNTEQLYFTANREVLASVGVTLDESAYVELFLREGTGAWHLVLGRGFSAADIASLRARRDQLYTDLLSGSDIIMPGVAELLPRLARRHRLAVVTSSQPEPFARTHARTGLLPHFEFALTRVDYVRSKPDPEPYRLAVERMQLPPERCLVIEDSERGLRSAKAAGLTCWMIPSALTRGCLFAGADALFESLADVVAHLGE